MNYCFNGRSATPDTPNHPPAPKQATGCTFHLEPLYSAPPSRIRSRYVTGSEPADIETEFGNGTLVQVRFEQNSRWSIWVSNGDAWKRRKDFASPSAEHACRTAEQWYGLPVVEWRPAKGEVL